jgi:hypothetical protein
MMHDQTQFVSTHQIHAAKLDLARVHEDPHARRIQETVLTLIGSLILAQTEAYLSVAQSSQSEFTVHIGDMDVIEGVELIDEASDFGMTVDQAVVHLARAKSILEEAQKRNGADREVTYQLLRCLFYTVRNLHPVSPQCSSPGTCSLHAEIRALLQQVCTTLENLFLDQSHPLDGDLRCRGLRLAANAWAELASQSVIHRLDVWTEELENCNRLFDVLIGFATDDNRCYVYLQWARCLLRVGRLLQDCEHDSAEYLEQYDQACVACAKAEETEGRLLDILERDRHACMFIHVWVESILRSFACVRQSSLDFYLPRLANMTRLLLELRRRKESCVEPRRHLNYALSTVEIFAAQLKVQFGQGEYADIMSDLNEKLEDYPTDVCVVLEREYALEVLDDRFLLAVDLMA